jgi:hypothetical protein
MYKPVEDIDGWAIELGKRIVISGIEEFKDAQEVCDILNVSEEGFDKKIDDALRSCLPCVK